MENKFVKVRGIDNSEVIEIPLELDNTLSLAVLLSQYPYATGLKYRNPKNNQIRTVRRTDGKFFLSADLTWDDFTFFLVCSPSLYCLIIIRSLLTSDISYRPTKQSNGKSFKVPMANKRNYENQKPSNLSIGNSRKPLISWPSACHTIPLKWNWGNISCASAN